jgi:hypothetical protein
MPALLESLFKQKSLGGLRFGEVIRRLLERRLVFHVEAGLGAINLAHQSTENFSWPDFNKRLRSAVD